MQKFTHIVILLVIVVFVGFCFSKPATNDSMEVMHNVTDALEERGEYKCSVCGHDFSKDSFSEGKSHSVNIVTRECVCFSCGGE